MSFARRVVSVSLGAGLFFGLPNLPSRSNNRLNSAVPSDTVKKQPVLSYGLAAEVYRTFVTNPSTDYFEIEKSETISEDPILHANTSVEIRISDKEEIGILAKDDGDDLIEKNEVVFLAHFYASRGSVIQTSVLKTGVDPLTHEDRFTASRLFAANKNPFVRLDMNAYNQPYDWTPHTDKNTWPKPTGCLFGIFKRSGCNWPSMT